ncbi:MAG: BACON domain-containing protein [Candidatus Zixiibacteriota bacterium]
MSKIISGIIFILISIALVFSGCAKKGTDDNNDNGTNNAPQIQSVSPSSASTNDVITLTVVATDEDEDDLSYSWSVSGNNGTLQPPTTGSSVNWIAPSSAGTYLVTITVSDGDLTDNYIHAINVTTGSSTTNKGTISGYVMDLSGFSYYKMLDDENQDVSELFRFIENATVTMDTFSIVTGRSGIYMFSGIPYGSYTISVSADDYSSKDTTITLNSRSKQVDFHMVSLIPNYSLDISTTSLDMGSSETSAYFSITNSGRNNTSWRASESESWLSLSRTSGSLSPGDIDSVRVDVDRSVLVPGDFIGNIFMSSPDADIADIQVNISIADVVIESIQIADSIIEISNTYTVTSALSDSGSGSLSYSWSVDSGSISSSGATADWTTPSTEGDYSIELIVSDGTIADTLSQSFTVIEIFPEEYDVQIISPADGDTLGIDTVLIQIGITPLHGDTLPSRVNIYLDADSIGVAYDSDMDSIYTYTWDPPDSSGLHSLLASALHSTDSGTSSSDVISIYIDAIGALFSNSRK